MRVGHDLGIRVAGRGDQRLPVRVIHELRPVLLSRRHVLEHEHVGQARKPCADDVRAEEHRLEPGTAKDIDLALVEHLGLLAVRGLVVALVGAQLEHARRRRQRAGWFLEGGNPVKCHHQLRVDAHVAGIGRRQAQERKLVLRIGLEPGIDFGDRLDVLVGQQHPERRAVGPERYGEHANRTDPGTTIRRQRLVLEVIGEPLPHRHAEVVLAQLAVLGRLFLRHLRIGARCQRPRAGSRQRCREEATTIHAFSAFRSSR